MRTDSASAVAPGTSTEGRMRAAALVGPGRFELLTVPRPVPGPGQIRLRIEGCGVCGSNLPPWEGGEGFQYPFSPGAPGHEAWGTVDAAGPGARAFPPGSRVAGLCGSAFAEFEVVDESTAVPLSPALHGQPFPGEALGCAMNIFRRSDIASGQTVAIVGVGFLGALLTRLASQAGARVIALSRRPFALDLARAFGAWRTVSLGAESGALEEVAALTEGHLCERVIEAVGKQEALDLATQLTRERGRLVIAGYHQDGPRRIDLRLWNWRGLDVINAHERDPQVYREGIRLAEAAVASGRLDPSALYTHRFKLADIADAFHALRERPPGFLKALVIP